VHIGRWLQAQGYEFVTVTPATHARVLARRAPTRARDLRDAFGWSMPFDESLLPREMVARLRDAALLEPCGHGLLRAAIRFSTLGGLIFAHSSFPTDHNESVFFGPDTYRFVSLIRRELAQRPLRARGRILDLGCGSGAGGLAAAAASGACAEPALVLSDISAEALVFARANAELAGVQGAELALSDLFSAVAGDFDLVVANPPYLNDESQRLYRHGGGRWGEALSLRILREGLSRLAPGGRLVLYTGSSIAAGVDFLQGAFKAYLAGQECTWSYEEIDPDVFGEELGRPAYADVERIAAVALIVRKP
jgi:methylase of polypeptide subunit release factors